MSEPIKPGDLAIIVHQCCDTESDLGTIVRVLRLYTDRCRCTYCGFKDPSVLFAECEDIDFGCGIPVAWLKRIPPLGELDDVKHDEEITA